MKKILLFLILFLIPCVVMADTEVFKQTGEVKNGEILLSMNSYKDGYITVSAQKSETGGTAYLRYIDKKGNTIKQAELEDVTLYDSVIANGNDIYLFEEERYLCTLKKYNEDLEKQSEINFVDCVTSYYGSLGIFTNEHPAVIKDNYIYIHDINNNEIIKADLDLSSSSTIEITETNIKEIFPEEYYYNKIQETTTGQFKIQNYNVTGDYIIANFSSQDLNCQADDETCGAQYIRIYDKEINLIKEFLIPLNATNESVETVFFGTIIKGYLILSAYTITGENNIANINSTKNILKIYDLDWNLVQAIEKEGTLSTFAIETENGFLVNNLVPFFNNEQTTCETMMFYSLKSPIETPTIDHGRVIVPSNALAGETVTIEVKPDKGFTLSELTVLDANGNKIPVTNNTFVMGTSKVTVLATFTPENPNTGNFYVILICLIAAISGIVLVFQKRKLDFLK